MQRGEPAGLAPPLHRLPATPVFRMDRALAPPDPPWPPIAGGGQAQAGAVSGYLNVSLSPFSVAPLL